MSVFEEYTTYYDLLYKDKNYFGEAQYVAGLLSRYGLKPSPGTSILDIGCGTGGHARPLAAMGYDVVGVDRSASMVACARANGGTPQYCIADALNLQLRQQFDAIISLFHVMSYQTTDETLEGAFDSVSRHLKPGGLFLFDFWYGPAVLNRPPVPRVLRVEDDRVIVRRFTEPLLRERENVVDVAFEVWVQEKGTQVARVFQETHPMRYLFLPEIRHLLERRGFTIAAELKWMDPEKPPTLSDRNAIVVARR